MCGNSWVRSRIGEGISRRVAETREKRRERRGMRENEVSGMIVDAAFAIHSALGPGLLESVYEATMVHELRSRGLEVGTQRAIPVDYGGVKLGLGFRADSIVAGLVLVELKSIEEVAPIHKKQLLTYLRLAGLRLGLLINFNVCLIKEGIHRVVNNLY
jgi:GxxExxY protein